MSHKISYAIARKLIHNFRVSELEPIANNLSFGASIGKDAVWGLFESVQEKASLAPPVIGSLAHYCFDKTLPNFKLFVAFESALVDIESVDDRVQSEFCVYPGVSARFRIPDGVSIDEFLTDKSKNTTRPNDLEMDPTEVDIKMEEFRSKLQINEKRGGFFSDSPIEEVTEFLQQNSGNIFVRYFFGFDDTTQSKNPLRLILIAVNNLTNEN
jgi:hypothetical protein